MSKTRLLPSQTGPHGYRRGIRPHAGVKVHTHAKTGNVEFASAHDLRRSFGTRWARLVPTAVLMQLMRHESIQTTSTYYLDLDADKITEDLYRVSGQTGMARSNNIATRKAQPMPYFTVLSQNR